MVAGLLLLPFTRTYAGTIESSILQINLDRVYFQTGEEGLVTPGANWWVLCREDTLAAGRIEWSAPGVSISTVGFGWLDTVNCQSMSAGIEIPEINEDASLEVEITPLLPWPNMVLQWPTGGDPVHPVTATGHPVYLFDELELPSSASGQLSVHLTTTERQYNHFATSWLPSIVVLIPNLSSQFNRDGFLTTSLYYRFGDSHLPYLIEADSVQRVDTFYPADTTIARLYPFDSRRGRALMSALDDTPDTITIGYRGKAVRPTAEFFADILARDRFAVSIVEENTSVTPDILVDWIPYHNMSPDVGVRTLVGQLRRTAPTDERLNESLDVIEQYLSLVEGSQSADARNYYLRLIDRSLKEDLGVFPLFRPSVTVSKSTDVRGLRFNADGLLDIDSVVILSTGNPDSVQGNR